MSDGVTESVVRLRRTDPAQVALQVRQEIHKGGVSSLVVDLGEGIMVVERAQEAQQRLDLATTQQEVMGEGLDPMDVVLREGVHELRVTGMSLREAMFEAAHIASKSGGVVAFWSCGNIPLFADLGKFDVPLLKTAALQLLGAPVLESEHLDPEHLMACVAPMVGALPIEVEHGLLIRMDDLSHGPTTQPYRRSTPQDQPDPPARRPTDGGGGETGPRSSRPPVWFGG